MDIVFSRYEVVKSADVRRVRLVFTSPNPDPSPIDGVLYSEADIELTDAQVTALAQVVAPATPTQAQVDAFWNLVTPELGRVWRNNTIKQRLDVMLARTKVI